MVIGEPAKVEHIARVIRGNEGTGFEIVGAITKRPLAGPGLDELPVISDYRGAVAAIDAVGADVLIVASADDLPPRTIRRLGWAMAELVAKGEPGPLAADFGLNRFREGRFIDESVAAGVAH